MADVAIEAYLDSLSSSQSSICRKLHALVNGHALAARAMIYHGVLGYATSESPFDRIIYIARQRNWVNLGFFFGKDIPDPHKLLVGEGARMRHIKITGESDLDNPALGRIIRAAWKKSPRDISRLHANRKEKRPHTHRDKRSSAGGLGTSAQNAK